MTKYVEISDFFPKTYCMIYTDEGACQSELN